MSIEVIYDEAHDCYLLPIPDDLLDELGWELGDVLSWCFTDKQNFLRKIKLQDDE